MTDGDPPEGSLNAPEGPLISSTTYSTNTLSMQLFPHGAMQESREVSGVPSSLSSQDAPNRESNQDLTGSGCSDEHDVEAGVRGAAGTLTPADSSENTPAKRTSFLDLLESSSSQLADPTDPYNRSPRSTLEARHCVSYLDCNNSDDPAIQDRKQRFPLSFPTGDLPVRNHLTIPDNIYSMRPGTLISYSTESSPSNVWPALKDISRAPARYTLYPLPRINFDKKATLDIDRCDLSWMGRRSLLYSSSPPIVPPTQGQSWPQTRLPIEVFQQIAGYLSQDDVKSLRLTCKRFDWHISAVLFKTVVVPFHAGIFNSEFKIPEADRKGKGKSKSREINIFKSYGHRITKFGMSFELSEELLACPPKKTKLDLVESFWGSYLWPFADYRRYTHVAELEETGDNSSGMSEAFADLTRLEELGLSLDSGLGWLAGPDKSIRAQIMQDRRPIFPTNYALPSRKQQAQRALWDLIESQYDERYDRDGLLASRLYNIDVPRTARQQHVPYSGIASELQFIDRRILMEAHTINGEPYSFPSPSGFLFTSKAPPGGMGEQKSHPIQPISLTQDQEDLLLETQWAQHAFLTSYMVAVMNNPETCGSVHTLTIARLPGQLVSTLQRDDFWSALPGLTTVKIHIIGEVREVQKNNFDSAKSSPIDPSRATSSFRCLLANMIAPRCHIKDLTIGWASGGEHALGLFGRNKHLLPAPFMEDFRDPLHEGIVIFPHLEKLTISNCWIQGNVLENMVALHKGHQLRKLTLDSVSLLILPVNQGGGIPGNAQVQPAPLVQLMPGQGPQFMMGQPAPQPQAHSFLLAQALNLPVGPLIQPQAPLQNTIPVPGLVQPNNLPLNNPQTVISDGWKDFQRLGSWPFVLDMISPGQRLRDFGGTSRNRGQNTSLKEIELISCGYNVLGRAGYRLNDVDPEFRIQNHAQTSNAARYDARRDALAPVMMAVQDPLLGEIIQHIPRKESDALEIVWGMRLGWSDNDASDAFLYDDCFSGGTGRFSGVIRNTDCISRGPNEKRSFREAFSE